MIKRKIIQIAVIVCIGQCVFASGIYTEFLSINNGLFEDGTIYFARQKLLKYDGDKKTEEIPVVSIMSTENQFSIIKEKKEELFFLSMKKGYWIANNKLRMPMKISGSYKISEIDVQDILRIDFENDFKLVDQTEEIVTLERKNKRISYYYAELQKKGDAFELILQDRNKQNIKKMVYEVGFLNKKKCFDTISVYDLVFETQKKNVYITEEYVEIKNFPQSLFNQNNFKELSVYAKKY